MATGCWMLMLATVMMMVTAVVSSPQAGLFLPRYMQCSTVWPRESFLSVCLTVCQTRDL